MYSLIGFIALTSTALSALPDQQLWMRNYTAGLKKANVDHKPLVVVVGTGQNGFDKVVREGKLDDQTRQLLADKYVCVFIDGSQAAQANVLKDLSIATGQGIVISDSKGQWMAFHHDGTLAQADLQKYLRQFADPNLEVRTTQTHSTVRTSFYGDGSSTGGYTTIRSVSC